MFNDELEYYSYNNLLTEDENNHPYISIVMNADTKPLLYKDMTAIVEAIPEK